MRTHHIRRGRFVTLTCVLLATTAQLSGCSSGEPNGSAGAAPGASSSVRPTPSEVTGAAPSTETAVSSAPMPIDTERWTAYFSKTYDLRVLHPPSWSATPAVRTWRLDTDGDDPRSPAHDAFRSPKGDVRVSVWDAPWDRTIREETPADVLAWVEDYCEATGNTPCSGIGDRAVALCLEKRDCHPGLMVLFRNNIQAFFTGGIYDADAMTVVAVWRGEAAPSVSRYGGAQRLLLGFLSTMEVFVDPAPGSDGP